MRKLKENMGFTLVELMISSSVFVILIAVVSGTFINALRTQRIITNLSESMNNASFAIEEMSREIRVGFGFGVVGDSLSYLNSFGDEIVYRRDEHDDTGVYGIERCENSSCEFVTSPDVNIENLEFILQGTEEGDGLPPRVTILMTVLGEREIRVNLQTTISSRVLNS